MLHKNEDGSFMSPEQIRDFVILHMNDVERDWFQKCTRESLSNLHFTYGETIRKDFGLFDGNNPHTNPHASINPETGKREDPLYPDNLSHTILESIWDKIHEEDHS